MSKSKDSATDNEDLSCLASYLKRTSTLTDEKIFASLVMQFDATPYRWSGSSTDGSDCSGLCCACLNALCGTSTRVTADYLYHHYFIRGGDMQKEGIWAAFFLNDEGKAVHIACRIYDDYFMNESSIEKDKKANVRTLDELKVMYSSYKMVLQKLDADLWIHGIGQF